MVHPLLFYDAQVFLSVGRVRRANTTVHNIRGGLHVTEGRPEGEQQPHTRPVRPGVPGQP